jgi:hypothetical protein
MTVSSLVRTVETIYFVRKYSAIILTLVAVQLEKIAMRNQTKRRKKYYGVIYEKEA